MATANITTAYTLADFAKNLAPDGSIADVAELLSQRNEILEDMLWIEGNLPTGHRDSVRTSLPTPTWRRVNQGVDPSKTTETQVTDTCGMSEAIAIIDKALADLNGNSARWRMSQNKGSSRAWRRTWPPSSSTRTPRLRPRSRWASRRASPRSRPARRRRANNIVCGAGSTSSQQSSIWLVGWGDDKVRGIFPKGSKAGLQDTDEGEDWAFDANNKRYKAYITHYVWKAGLSVKDWRYIVRIANIDTSTNAGGLRSSTPPDLVDLVDQAIAKIPNLGALPSGALHEPHGQAPLQQAAQPRCPGVEHGQPPTIRDTSDG